MSYVIKTSTGRAYFDHAGCFSGARDARKFETIQDAIDEMGKWVGQIVDIEIDGDVADVAFVQGCSASVYEIISA